MRDNEIKARAPAGKPSEIPGEGWREVLNATYRSLGAVIVFLTWLYLTAYILLMGGELNAELEKQTSCSTQEV